MPRYQSIQAKRPGAVGGGGLRAADAAGTSPGAVAGGGATVGAVNLQARYHSVIGVGKPISAAAGGGLPPDVVRHRRRLIYISG